MSLFDKRLSEIHSALRAKELSVTDLVQASIASIKEHDEKSSPSCTWMRRERSPMLASWTSVWLRRTGSLAFFGLPAGLKDNLITKTYGRPAPANFWRTTILSMTELLRKR